MDNWDHSHSRSVIPFVLTLANPLLVNRGRNGASIRNAMLQSAVTASGDGHTAVAVSHGVWGVGSVASHIQPMTADVN